MKIQRVMSKLDDYEENLLELKSHPSKENKDLMCAIRGKIKSIILELYSEKEINKLFQGIFKPFYFAPSGEFEFYNRDIENCLGGIQIIKDNYELGKFSEKKDINTDKSNSQINITNTNNNINQFNLQINSFKEIYSLLESKDYANKDEIKETIKQIEEESEKENIEKSKINKLIDKIKNIGSDFLKDVPLSVITNLVAQKIMGGF